MDLFDFVVSNKDEIEKLQEESENGLIYLDASDFDFSHDEVQFELASESEDEEAQEGTVRFFVEAGKYKLLCELTYEELADNLDDLENISDPDIREKVIEALENDIEPALSEQVDEAKDEVENIKGLLKEAEDRHDNVKGSLSKLKNKWGVP